MACRSDAFTHSGGTAPDSHRLPFYAPHGHPRQTAILAQQARPAELGYANVHVREGDGYTGWPERAPFDRILLTAAPATIPQPLIDQLAVGGRLVAPVGPQHQTQWIVVLEKNAERVVEERTIPVAFVPFTRR